MATKRLNSQTKKISRINKLQIGLTSSLRHGVYEKRKETELEIMDLWKQINKK